MPLYLGCFFVALLIRIGLVILTPSLNNMIDLQIYREAGQLITHGVNPYDFSDKLEIRNQLKNNTENHNEFVNSSQVQWNNYTSANLPLATLFFGAIEYAFGSNRSFRLTFAFFDSILSVLIIVIILNKWNYRSSIFFFRNNLTIKQREYFLPLVALTLGAFSPILLLWGTFYPEHKGIGLLLILSAIYFSDSYNRNARMILSPILLAFSVAFIGLGIFVAPLCLFNTYKKGNFKQILIYCIISFVTCILILLPFMPGLLNMMISRLGLAPNAEKIPLHGSMWVLIYKAFPGYWLVIKNSFLVLFISINVIGFFRKKLNVFVVSASLLYLFTNIYLINGSLDRMNIALLTLIILLGYSKYVVFSIRLTMFYIFFGLFAFIGNASSLWSETYDGFFMLIVTIIYFIFLLTQTIKPQKESFQKYSAYL